MVTFVASLIGAAAVLARVSAVPMDYGGDMSSAAPPAMMTSGSSGYGNNNYGSGDKSYSSSAAPPSYTMSSGSSGYGNNNNKYGSSSMSSSSSYSPPSYGSGSSSWNNGNNGGYDSCVQQCVAQYGSPSNMYMPPPSSTSNSGSSGSGKTHTVIVAPSQGVLRYVPFALNASVGDTVMFMWGANNHTVTKSSELALCNKTSDQPFASGEQNKSFTFTQVVNDTNPTFFYCGTPNHCEKGMFGIINPPSAYMQAGSASMMMPSLASQYPSTQAAMSYTSNVTSNQSSAASWGMNIDMSGMPSWSQQYTADNLLYTQAVMAMNPDMVSNGALDLSSMGSQPIMLPTDVAAALASNNANNSTSSYGSSASSSPSGSSSASSPSTSPVAASSKNGAGVLSSPRVAVAVVAVVAAFFAL
jgi:plastocyanin